MDHILLVEKARGRYAYDCCNMCSPQNGLNWL